MQRADLKLPRAIRLSLVALACVTLGLAACGGSGQDTDTNGLLSDLGSVTLSVEASDLPADVADLQVQPLFHLAPIVLDEPADSDATDNSASARQPAHAQNVDEALGGLSTERLTIQSMSSARRMHAMGAGSSSLNGSASPMAAGSTVSTYTPAQIRAAYGMPPLPAAGVTPTALQAAQMGAGQTIYIVNAYHDPNIVAELNAFNAKFGLPGCTVKSIATNATLPLPAASKTEGCVFSVVYNTPSATMTSTAPAFESGWATEIALDVQWAHATAPLARIILIEAPDASINSLLGGIKLANAMGPGAVSMSFGTTEGTWTSSVDTAFTGTGMTYLAATGDWGTQVSWPSVSPRVVAVGGTSLSYTGSGSRTEVGWSSTGGGISLYTPTPTYQANTVPGMGNMVRRAVADVGFNANPSTGQFVAVMQPGSSAVSWVSAGGTSLSTPQWAGLVAVANALRAQSGAAALGTPHAVLYGTIGSTPGTYASAFSDIQSGSNGSCPICSAKTGYDGLTGLGTPNVTGLLAALGGSSTSTSAPSVTSVAMAGTVGKALNFNLSVVASNPVTYTLSGAPSGLTINSAGSVSWPSPVAGTYSVGVKAQDTKTGLSGQGAISLRIDPAPVAPIVGSATVTGQVGKALSFRVSAQAANPLRFSMSGAPSGMTIGSTGVVSWANPVAGTFAVTVTATNTVSGLSGKGLYTVKIQPLSPPTITASALSGTAGQPLTGTIKVSDPNGYAMGVSISGVPLGMRFAVSGQTITFSWAKPVAGNFKLSITVMNSAGGRAQATMPITIR